MFQFFLVATSTKSWAARPYELWIVPVIASVLITYYFGKRYFDCKMMMNILNRRESTLKLLRNSYYASLCLCFVVIFRFLYLWISFFL